MSGHEDRQPTAARPGFFYGYIVVVAGFIVMVLSWGAFFSFGIFFKPLLTEFGWTSAMTAGAFTIGSLIRGFISIVTGKLSDRFNLRMVTTACCILLGLGFLLMSRINHIWELYLFYGVIAATGIAGCWTPLMAAVARWFIKKRGLMTGIVSSGIGVGGVIIPLVATRLIYTYDWRISYIVLGGIVLVGAVLAAQFLKRDPRQMGQLPYGEGEVNRGSVTPKADGLSLPDAVNTRQFWMICAAYFCYGYFVHTITVHIVPHVTELGISPISAANILAVIGGLSVVGRVVMGGASDRIGIKLSIILNFILAAGILFWLQLAREMWMLYLFAVGIGFAYGGLSSLQSLVAAELFGLRSLGVMVGTLTFSFTMGNAVGVFLAGYIFDSTGSYYPAFWACAVVAIVGLILVLLLTPVRPEYGANEMPYRSS